MHDASSSTLLGPVGLELLHLALTITVGVIAYFARRSLRDLDDIKKDVEETKQDVSWIRGYLRIPPR